MSRVSPEHALLQELHAGQRMRGRLLLRTFAVLYAHELLALCPPEALDRLLLAVKMHIDLSIEPVCPQTCGVMVCGPALIVRRAIRA